jgi:uncharacterized repeat protein (TIGR03803 family)
MEASMCRSLTLVLVAFVAAADPARAQVVPDVVHAFSRGPGAPFGKLVRDPDGTLYGTTAAGGPSSAGSVFALKPTPGGGWDYVTLHMFNGANGKSQIGGLIRGQDGAFYGTTLHGGNRGNAGTIFRITTAGEFSTLFSFSSQDPSLGGTPVGRLVQTPDGSLYGTTLNVPFQSPPSGEGGTVFKLSAAGVATMLHEFDSYNEGRNPYSSVIMASDGNFYGTLYDGGATAPSRLGGIYRITPGGTFTLLHQFGSLDGSRPFGPLVEGPDGFLYGTASSYPIAGGTFFKIDKSGNYTVLHVFSGSPVAFPTDLVLGRDGNFYGTAASHGVAGGSVFTLTPAGDLEVLHVCESADGMNLYGGLTEGEDGVFYGAALSGGTGDLGTIYRITRTGVFTVLHSFDNHDGIAPYAPVMQASDGNIYGTTIAGGADSLNGKGTIFRLTSGGQFTELHSVAPDEAGHPAGGLLQANDGHLYGLTQASVFRMALDGTFTTLHTFNVTTDGSDPGFAALTQGRDGQLYGTTSRGGSGGHGTVFRITLSGTFTVLHAFAGAEGTEPYGGVVQGADGNFYGTTSSGGAFGYGTVFRMTPAGTVTVLHAFNYSDGAIPLATVIQGSDGKLYGTTFIGGPGSAGTVFSVSLAGAFTTLHAFTARTGWEDVVRPVGRLLQASDGKYYGTGTANGSTDNPYVFRITSGGVFESVATLFPDVPSPGGTVSAGLIQASDRSLYGTTALGGTGRAGTVYRIVIPGF